MEVETIKRQTRAAYGWSVEGQSVATLVCHRVTGWTCLSARLSRSPVSTLWNSLPDRCRDPTRNSDSFRGNYLKCGIICELLNTLSAAGCFKCCTNFRLTLNWHWNCRAPIQTEELILEAVHECSAGSTGNEWDRVGINIVLRRIVRPLLTCRPFSALVVFALSLVCTLFVLQSHKHNTKSSPCNRSISWLGFNKGSVA